MKTRIDFVSNSSSCSFVVKQTDKTKISDIIDNGFLKVLLRIVIQSPRAHDVYFCSDCFSDDVLSQCNASDSFSVKSKSKIKLQDKKHDLADIKEYSLLKNVANEATSMIFDWGDDDSDAFTVKMNQVGAVFELVGYKIDDEDSSTPYDSVKWMTEDNDES